MKIVHSETDKVSDYDDVISEAAYQAHRNLSDEENPQIQIILDDHANLSFGLACYNIYSDNVYLSMPAMVKYTRLFNSSEKKRAFFSGVVAHEITHKLQWKAGMNLVESSRNPNYWDCPFEKAANLIGGQIASLMFPELRGMWWSWSDHPQYRIQLWHKLGIGFQLYD